jgi:riboflavin biosynthesis pyrimidine reductase
MTAEALLGFAAAHGFEVAVDDEGPAPEAGLLAVYGGKLRVRRDVPRLVANFVSTADGVTAFGESRGEGAAAVSLHSAADRFVMALLRCAADCVLIGATTLRDDPHHQWTPVTPMRELAGELTEHRRALTGSEEPPLLAVVTASGALPRGHPALSTPEADVLVITTRSGAERLTGLHPRVRVAVAGSVGRIAPATLVEAVRERSAANTILCEGGPGLFGQLLADGRVDELFLTISPLLAGRSGAAPRLGVVSEVAMSPETAPRLSLRSLRRSGDHLFVRYAVGMGPAAPAGVSG